MLILLTSVCSSGCVKHAEPNPEYKDRLYLEFVNESKNAQKNIEDTKKIVEAEMASSEKAPAQIGMKKAFIARADHAQNVLESYRQQEKYWKIRAEDRLGYVRRENLKAFNAGKEFNDQKEFEQYQLEKRLRQARRKAVKKPESEPEKPAKTAEKAE